MRSAFRRGVELLSEPESDSVQSEGKSAGKSASEQMEGIDRVPKNVAQLKPIIDKLMCKVIVIAVWPVSANATQDLPKGADQQWLLKAKEYAQWVEKKVSKEEEYVKDLLTELEAVIALKNSQLGEGFSNEETDWF
jgi:hypothetical protein